MSNKNTYESSAVVEHYSTVDELQKPELTILAKLKGKLKNMKMLDLGVGGGRTTIYFAELVKEYVGVDYSSSMIDACKKRFSRQENVTFAVADARDLNAFGDHSFDFVLFSFNGLDYIDHSDRNKAFGEIKRILKRGGIFVFSTHNIGSLGQLYAVKYTINPIKLGWRLFRFCILILLNGLSSHKKDQEWTIINDGAHRFKLKTHYIKMTYQIRQLSELGFKDIQLYSLEDGEEIDMTEVDERTDPWIYCLCSI